MRQANGDIFGADLCMYCESPEIDPYEHIKCDLCREIAIATGEDFCPLHPKSGPTLTPSPVFELEAGQACLF